MIDLQEVSKTFLTREARVEALREVSIHVNPGDIYGIIGFSGAGKSTLIRLVNRLEVPDSGRVLVDGRGILRGAGLAVAGRETLIAEAE